MHMAQPKGAARNRKYASVTVIPGYYGYGYPYYGYGYGYDYGWPWFGVGIGYGYGYPYGYGYGYGYRRGFHRFGYHGYGYRGFARTFPRAGVTTAGFTGERFGGLGGAHFARAGFGGGHFGGSAAPTSPEADSVGPTSPAAAARLRRRRIRWGPLRRRRRAFRRRRRTLPLILGYQPDSRRTGRRARPFFGRAAGFSA